MRVPEKVRTNTGNLHSGFSGSTHCVLTVAISTNSETSVFTQSTDATAAAQRCHKVQDDEGLTKTSAHRQRHSAHGPPDPKSQNMPISSTRPATKHGNAMQLLLAAVSTQTHVQRRSKARPLVKRAWPAAQQTATRIKKIPPHRRLPSKALLPKPGSEKLS